MPPNPLCYYAKSNSTPPKQNFLRHHINKPIKNNRPSSFGIPSNVVNIFYKNNYVCSFLKLPKFLSRFSFFLKRLLCNVSLYRQCLSSAYGHAESLFCLVMAFFLHPFLGEGGGGVSSQLIRDTGGNAPKIISNEEGRHKNLYYVKFHEPLPPPP